MTYGELISDLTYSSYRYNRIRAPQISPQRWAKIFANVAEMEKRYQEESSKTEDTKCITLI